MISDNDTITSSNQSFMASAVSGGVAGQRPFILLWNPVGSGVSVFCDAVCPAAPPVLPTSDAWTGYDLRPCNTQMGESFVLSWPKLVGGAIGKAKVLQGNAVANTLPHFNDGRMREYWFEGASIDRPNQFFTPAVEIPPGNGILLTGASDGGTGIGSFEWREYSIV